MTPRYPQGAALTRARLIYLAACLAVGAILTLGGAL
jgi:hypothetical protein